MNRNCQTFFGHLGVPGDHPENEQNPYIQGGLLPPLGDPKFLKYFFHMVIFNLSQLRYE